MADRHNLQKLIKFESAVQLSAELTLRIKMNLSKSLVYLVFLLLTSLLNSTLAAPLSNQEKLDYVKGAVPACVARQSFNRKLDRYEQAGLEMYCDCHADVMAANLTREEMTQLSKGSTPNSLPPKVKKAQAKCIANILK